MKKITKIMSCALLITILLPALAACAKKPEQQGSAGPVLSKIKSSGKLVVGTSADYPPYEFHIIENGKDKIVGFDMDIAAEIAKDLGVQLVINDMDFKALLGALQAGKVDMVMAGMTPDEERKKSVDFSDIYYMAEQAIVVRAEDAGKFKTIDDFSGLKVTTQQGTIQEEIAKEQIKEGKFKTLARVGDLVLDLKSKKADVIILEKPVAEMYVKENKDLVISSVKPEEEEGGSAVAVAKGNEDFVKLINETLDRLKKENKIDTFVTEATKLADKYAKE